MDIDYYDPNLLRIGEFGVFYNFLLVIKPVDSDKYNPNRFATLEFLPAHFSDINHPTQNEIVLFELIFGEGTVKKIYDKIQ